MGRKLCRANEGMNKGAWTAIEDNILIDYIKENGQGKWRNVPEKTGLRRCGKSCRLRWLNYLRPDVKRGNISRDEEDLIVRMHKLLGNRWSLIAGRLPGRTDNEIKNYWNTHLSKKTPRRRLNKVKDEKKPRASKCKTFRASTQHQGMPLGNNNGDDANATKIGPSMNPIMVMESEHSGDSSLLGLKSDIFSDFFMDFDMGEISLSDILDLDNAQDRTLSDGCNNNVCYMNDHPTLFPNQTVYVPETKVENWRETSYDRVNEDPDLGALATIFESTEEWLETDPIW